MSRAIDTLRNSVLLSSKGVQPAAGRLSQTLALRLGLPLGDPLSLPPVP